MRNKKMKSVMQHNFGVTPTVEAPRSVFNLSHGHKTAIDVDYIYPLCVLDVLPGDTIRARSSILARMNTPQFPMMENVTLLEEWIAVPVRLVWENFRKFCGEQDNPTDSIDYTIPQFNSFTPSAESLHDYLGLPIRNLAMTPNSIYHRGYAKCYNDWYRDQNLIDSVHLDTDDGPDTATDYVLQKRGKRFDYYTQALPQPQKGDAVSLPLGTTAPVQQDGNPLSVRDSGSTWTKDLGSVTSDANVKFSGTAPSTSGSIYFSGGLEADLTSATAATINDLREAMSIQKLLEMDQRGGTRYPEIVANHFQVSFHEPSVRSEVLSINRSPLNITPTPTTANTSAQVTTGVPGHLGAYATIGSTEGGFTKSFYEHCIIYAMYSIVSDLTYSQGMPIRFTKQTRYDYYWPALMGLGERTLELQELYYQNNASDSTAFGYIPRWDEYRFENSKITGIMRPDHSQSIDAWHLSEDFASAPTLNQTFIEYNTPVDRTVQITGEPDFIVDCYFDIKATRPIPTYGIPGVGVRL
jgi:hypothetical protein